MAKLIVDNITIELVSGMNVSFDSNGNIVVNQKQKSNLPSCWDEKGVLHETEVVEIRNVNINKYRTSVDMVRDNFQNIGDRAIVNTQGYSPKTIRTAFYNMGMKCSMKDRSDRSGYYYEICRTE